MHARRQGQAAAVMAARAEGAPSGERGPAAGSAMRTQSSATPDRQQRSAPVHRRSGPGHLAAIVHLRGPPPRHAHRPAVDLGLPKSEETPVPIPERPSDCISKPAELGEVLARLTAQSPPRNPASDGGCQVTGSIGTREKASMNASRRAGRLVSDSLGALTSPPFQTADCAANGPLRKTVGPSGRAVARNLAEVPEGARPAGRW
jgi:hypothetical protein